MACVCMKYKSWKTLSEWRKSQNKIRQEKSESAKNLSNANNMTIGGSAGELFVLGDYRFPRYANTY